MKMGSECGVGAWRSKTSLNFSNVQSERIYTQFTVASTFPKLGDRCRLAPITVRVWDGEYKDGSGTPEN